jgi:hypothetical protein
MKITRRAILFILSLATLLTMVAVAYAETRNFSQGSLRYTITTEDYHDFEISVRNGSRSDLPAHGTIVVSSGRQEVATCSFEGDISAGSTASLSAHCDFDQSADLHFGMRW